MFRHWLTAISILSVILTTSFLGDPRTGSSSEREDEKARTAVTDLEEHWLKALNEADVNAIAEVLADDFVRPAPDAGQFVNKPDLLRFYHSHLSPQGAEPKQIEDMKVTLYGATALARGVLTTKDSHGRAIRKLLFTDVFVKRAGTWQAVSAQENLVTALQKESH